MLSWVICCSWLYSAQAQDILSTGNIVTPTTQDSGSTWTNAVYQDGLTCWAWGYPGYCGPNAIVTPGNNLNFSYGSTYVYQQPWVASVLPDNGTGLIVRGYDFSFLAKNGNGWDDGRTDYLYALVRFWDTTGGRGTDNLLARADYNLTYQFNWTQFTLSETWATPLSAGQIGQVQYGFLGRDNNGWAGPYGPEITNISFSLRYSIDPCVSDPLWSPTCSGYAQALLASLAPAMTEPESVAPVIAAETVQDPGMATEIQALSATPESNAMPTPDSAGSTGRGAGADLGTVLGILATERDRVSAVERNTVTQAAESGQASIAAVQDQAQAVALEAHHDSQVQGSDVAGAAGGSVDSAAEVLNSGTGSGDRALGSGLVPGRWTATAAIESPDAVISMPTVISTAPRALTMDSSVPEVIAPGSDTPASVSAPRTNMTSESTDLAVPAQSSAISVSGFTAVDVQAAAQGQPSTGPAESVGVAQRADTGTEALGPQDFAALAQAPQGFAAYQRALPDQQFYASRDIYRNQTVVDNPRGRGLFGSTDRLHADMVQRQYQR